MRDRLGVECAVFCRYLIDADPSPKTTSLYRRAHECGTLAPRETEGRFQRALVAVARRSTALARLADCHARVFAPAGLLRRKLTLVLALLESDPAAFERVDRVDGGSLLSFGLRAGLLAGLFVLTLAGGLLFFVPLRLACVVLGSSKDA
jgi:hypothetical protein